MDDDIGHRHLRACARFSDAVAAAEARWSALSPCSEWDARAVVEHVIGFHDVLLLRPLGAKPHRPRDDVQERWRVTRDALAKVFTRPGFFDGVVDVPPIGNNPATQLDARAIVPMLTQDVLVHAWDLARAVGADDRLDPELCAFFLARLPDDRDALVATGTFGVPVDVDEDADVQSRLLARLGRDPKWRKRYE